MADSSITPAQQAFVEGLNQQLQTQFSSLLNGQFQTMNVPNGFYWGIQSGGNNYYNKNSLDQMNLQVIDASNGVLTVGDANFTTLYNSLMQAVVFAFSQSDATQIQKDQTNNSAQIQAVIKSFEDVMGSPITAAQMALAVPPTKIGYCQYYITKNYGGDVSTLPSTMSEFKTAYQTYQVSAQVSASLVSQSATGMKRIAAARANSSAGTADNGGLQTAANSYYQPFGPFPTQIDINSSLSTGSNTAKISFTIDNFSSQSSKLTVDTQVGFEVPILDLVEVGFSANAHYGLDKYASSSTVVKTTLTYPGVTFISTPLTDSNLSTDDTTGWYANDVLAAAIANVWTSGDNPPKTGYALKGTQFSVGDYFGPGKLFSRVKTWVVSNEPTIEMQFCGGQTSSIVSDFKQGSKVAVKLFGLFPIGSISQSYEVQTVDDTSVVGCVTVTMGPTTKLGVNPSSESKAYVIGGVPSYPPSNT